MGLRLLNEAVSAFRDALTVHTPSDTPTDWAITLHDLANALAVQGERAPHPEGVRLLYEALTAYRDTLTVHARALARPRPRQARRVRQLSRTDYPA